MHAMCGQTLRMSEEWDIFRHAWSSGLTLEYTGAALKLFGPFSLVPGLIKHLCVLWRAWPSPTCGTHHPSWGGSIEYGPCCCCSQHHRARIEWARGSSGTCWGGQIFCQLKQKLLKMVRQLKKHTLHLSNIFRLRTKTKKKKKKRFLFRFKSGLWRHQMKQVLDSLRS